MIKSSYSKYVNEEALRWLLVLITVFSWFVFPLMVKQLNPSVFDIGFVICLFLVSVIAFTSIRNQLALQTTQKMMLACWIGYLCALLLASINSTSTYSLVQWGVLFAKFLFLAFLLLYMNVKYIVATLRIYANLMVATVIFALIAVTAVAMGVHPLATVSLGGRLADVYFGTYYVLNTSICMPAPIFRIQGLSEEPGTYAFALLPAFFWLLMVEKAYVRSAVIVLGLMLSMSMGAGLFLLLLLPIMLKKYFTDYKVPVFFLCAISVIGLMYAVSDTCTSRHIKKMDDASIAILSEVKTNQGTFDKHASIALLEKSLSSSPGGKVRSYQDREDGLRAALSYLKVHVLGTGAALGAVTVNNSISIGYVVAALEAGVVGGLFYICLFSIMGWLALKAIITSSHESFEERVKLVVALSVCTVLVMGAQRIQPDLSLWHMWIYAMWFYLLQKTPSSKVAS